VDVSVAKLNLALNVRQIKVPDKGIDVQDKTPAQDAVELNRIDPFRNPIRDAFNRVIRYHHVAMYGGKRIGYCVAVLRDRRKGVVFGQDATFRSALHNFRHGPALVCDVKQELIVWLDYAGSSEQQWLLMNAGDDYPRSLALDESGHASFRGRGLLLDGFQSPKRSAYAEESDYGKRKSSPSSEACVEERDVFKITDVLFLGLGLGLLVFSILMALCINHKRKLLCAALVGLPGLVGASSPLWLFYATFVYPSSWGLPPDWIPERWKICEQRASQPMSSHGQNVSQKLLTPAKFPYYNNYMANVLDTDK
jgi:hypothetical protein